MSSHPTPVAKGVEAGEGAIPVETLLAATASDPELQAAVREADENGDGSLSIQEVVSVFTAQRKAKEGKKRMTRLAAVLGSTLLLMLAANAGLTYAVVALSADTSTSADGVMTVKGDPSKLVQTATFQGTADVAALLWLDPANATELKHLTVPTPEGFKFFQVAGGEVARGERAVFFDAAGANVTLTAAELSPLPLALPPVDGGAGAPAPGPGRRLLQTPESKIQGFCKSACFLPSGKLKTGIPQNCYAQCVSFVTAQVPVFRALPYGPAHVAGTQSYLAQAWDKACHTVFTDGTKGTPFSFVQLGYTNCWVPGTPLPKTAAQKTDLYSCCKYTMLAIPSVAGPNTTGSQAFQVTGTTEPGTA